MQGIENPPTQRGIIPRAFQHIFESIEVAENTKYLVHASYLEIYNEEIRDLLSSNIKQKLEVCNWTICTLFYPDEHDTGSLRKCLFGSVYSTPYLEHL